MISIVILTILEEAEKVDGSILIVDEEDGVQILFDGLSFFFSFFRGQGLTNKTQKTSVY